MCQMVKRLKYHSLPVQRGSLVSGLEIQVSLQVIDFGMWQETIGTQARFRFLSAILARNCSLVTNLPALSSSIPGAILSRAYTSQRSSSSRMRSPARTTSEAEL